jgi:rhodanese-related sulfurtransferase
VTDQRPPGIPTVDVVTAERLRREAGDGPPALIVDVREIGEIVAGRAADVVVMPLSQFALRFRELPTDRSLLLICHSGNRSAMAAGHLITNGWVRASNVAGGMIAWERAGLAVRRGPLEPGEGRLPEV